MKKRLLPALLLSLVSTLAFAEAPAGYYSRAIFSDDFSASAFGPRWGHYKSGSVVKDGVLVGITPEGSDHNGVDYVKIEPEKDLELSVRFRFVSDKAKGFNVWFDDKDYKGSHAGHIVRVGVSPTIVNIADGKTGSFRNDLHEKGSAKPSTLTAEEKAYLATKNKNFPVTVSLQDWHKLVMQTKGDEVSVSIDDKPVGTFKSEGAEHDHKNLVSLTTNQVDVEYDDFSIKGAAK